MDHSSSYLNINVGRFSIGNVGMPRLFSQKIVVVIEPACPSLDSSYCLDVETTVGPTK